MLLERNQVVVGVVFAVVIALATWFSVSLSGELFRDGTTVTAEFANSEGIQAGDDVLVAGLRAGSVESVELAGDRVEIRFLLEPEMPRDSSARLALRNFVGKRTLELIAGDDWDHLLQDEDEPRIPLDRTSTLVDLPDLSDETVDLLRDADTEALEALITSLADVTEGQRDEVGTLLDGLDRFSRVLADQRDALGALIQRSETVVDAIADEDQDLVRIIDGFGSTLDRLAANRGDLVELLDSTAGVTNRTADLIGDERARLDRILDELHEVLEIVDDHQVDLAHSFAYGGVSFYGFSQVAAEGEGDTPYWGNILTTSVGEGGIEAWAGCGGAIDRFLDAIFGPAECPEEERTNDEDGGAPAAPPAGSLRSLFGAVHP